MVTERKLGNAKRVHEEAHGHALDWVTQRREAFVRYLGLCECGGYRATYGSFDAFDRESSVRHNRS